MQHTNTATGKIPSPDCGKQFAPFSEGSNGDFNTKHHKVCIDCHLSLNQQRRKAHTNIAKPSVSSITTEGSEG